MSEKEHGGLKRPGRPVKGQQYSGKCDVRLSAKESSMLDILAERNNVTRSEVMRKALYDFWKFNSDEE